MFFEFCCKIAEISAREHEQPCLGKHGFNITLKGLGPEIRIVLKWYGLISLVEERVRQIFKNFLIVPLIGEINALCFMLLILY
jgi:hypothetical protein